MSENTNNTNAQVVRSEEEMVAIVSQVMQELGYTAPQPATPVVPDFKVRQRANAVANTAVIHATNVAGTVFNAALAILDVGLAVFDAGVSLPMAAYHGEIVQPSLSVEAVTARGEALARARARAATQEA